MDGRPQDRTAVLEAFSQALREVTAEEDPVLSINLIVRKNNAVIFASDGAPRG
jgi:hypothetical protein